MKRLALLILASTFCAAPTFAKPGDYPAICDSHDGNIQVRIEEEYPTGVFYGHAVRTFHTDTHRDTQFETSRLDDITLEAAYETYSGPGFTLTVLTPSADVQDCGTRVEPKCIGEFTGTFAGESVSATMTCYRDLH